MATTFIAVMMDIAVIKGTRFIAVTITLAN
jgi:hypothetical protein